MSDSSLRLVSWNVNGLRACSRKGFGRWLRGCGADIVGLQEVRALPEQLERRIRSPRGWHTRFFPAERRGYSGVAVYSRREPDWTRTSLGEPRFDREGRVLIAGFGRLAVANAYFPKGSGTARDNSRVPYKLDFYRALFDVLTDYRRRGYRVVVMGDFNTAHRAIDLANPRSNVRNSGFLPEEREEVSRWIASGWVDTFRSRCSEPGHYSWWSQRRGVRERNVGWRIDYLMASRAAARYLEEAFLCPSVRGSDHCPVGADFDRSILGRRGASEAPG